MEVLCKVLEGKIDHLIQAEKYLKKANKATNFSNAGYLKSLASNCISQHKFKNALELLTKAERIGEHLEGTQKMLFDVYLELGNYELAKVYLSKFVNFSDFDYLIRLSKWSDHEGDLDAAIKYMEKAKVIAVLKGMTLNDYLEEAIQQKVAQDKKVLESIPK